MDSTPAIVDSIILPYGAFYKEQRGRSAVAGVQWPDNPLNHQDRAQNLTLSGSELWDIDGGETDRGFFCTVPNFARRKPPLRITTTLSWDQVQYDHVVEESLELKTFFKAGKWKIHDLPLTKHLRTALTYWSSRRPGFEQEYESLPFGSTIVVESLHADFRETKFRLTPDLATERSWLTISAFANEVPISAARLSDITVPWESLELLSHPHENISIVRVAGQKDDISFVFKALMQDTHYMYHEMRLLLLVDSHLNIIARPHALVLKSRSDGEPGIAGFLLKLYPRPTLQQQLQTGGKAITMDEKVTWSCQLTSALLHVRNQPPKYFPDFKPNNIVFASSDEGDTSVSRLVLLDFEQRGTWYTWSPPEVRYVEYLELLALTAGEKSVRERYISAVNTAFPWWTPTSRDRSLQDAKNGYNLAWASLKPHALAKAQVYALGKVLWCIFEGLPSPDGPQSVESFLEDFKQDQQFPDMRVSPPVVQQLVQRCTAGAPEWGSHLPGVIRDDDRIVPFGEQGCAVTASETQKAATRWWRDELRLAEEYVRFEYVPGEHGGMPEHVAQLKRDIEERPSLEEILEKLSALEIERS